MQRKKWRKKGFTLIELTVVIAVLAIISTVIVAFSSLISAQVNRNNARADFLKHSVDFKTDIQEQFALFDRPDTTFYVTVDNENNLLSFNESKTQTFSFSTYGELELRVSTNGSLLKCELFNSTLQVTQTFVISSRCGATFQTGVSA